MSSAMSSKSEGPTLTAAPRASSNDAASTSIPPPPPPPPSKSDQQSEGQKLKEAGSSGSKSGGALKDPCCYHCQHKYGFSTCGIQVDSPTTDTSAAPFGSDDANQGSFYPPSWMYGQGSGGSASGRNYDSYYPPSWMYDQRSASSRQRGTFGGNNYPGSSGRNYGSHYPPSWMYGQGSNNSNQYQVGRGSGFLDDMYDQGTNATSGSGSNECPCGMPHPEPAGGGSSHNPQTCKFCQAKGNRGNKQLGKSPSSGNKNQAGPDFRSSDAPPKGAAKDDLTANLKELGAQLDAIKANNPTQQSRDQGYSSAGPVQQEVAYASGGNPGGSKQVSSGKASPAANSSAPSAAPQQ